MRLSDYWRGTNRALIDMAANGAPPFTPEEAEANGIEVNFSDLSMCRSAHDARSQMANAFIKPGNYTRWTTDMGDPNKRGDWGAIATRESNRIMKRSIPYFEKYRSTFALSTLHGIAPGVWANPDIWRPRSVGIDDVLIPGGTTLDMDDLPFYAIRHSWTAPQLIRMIRRPNVDKGWNIPLAEACLEWIDQQTTLLQSSIYPDMWSPEKQAERMKSDGACYAADCAPSLRVFDFNFWDDRGNVAGWRRRIIIDAWSDPTMAGGKVISGTRSLDRPFSKEFKNQFLYTSGDDIYSNSRQEVISFQFADLSAVAPFKYHSIRSIGFLLYAVCHIQNRMRCKFTESVFEALMMYFRVKSEEDLQHALKVKMWNRGFIDETLQFIPANERFQVRADLVELGLRMNDQLIADSSSSYNQNANHSPDQTEKTKFQVMAEVNAAQSLVSAGMLQAYQYQEAGEDREIQRRFLRINSADPEVRTFRANCLRQGVPEEILTPEAWDCTHERVLGTGNKTQEMQISQFLMDNFQKFDPEPQRQILHNVTTAVSDNAALADQLVPLKGVPVSDSRHDAQLAVGTLMMGLPVDVKLGLNHVDYCQELLKAMALICKKINDSGGVATQEQIEGLVNCGHAVEAHLKIIGQDEDNKALTKQIGDVLGRVMNQVKSFAQRLQQQREAESKQNGNGGIAPEAQAKVAAIALQAQTKAQLAKDSHAEKTAQRRISFEQKNAQDSEKHRQQLEQEAQRQKVSIAGEDLKVASQIHQEKARAENEPPPSSE